MSESPSDMSRGRRVAVNMGALAIGLVLCLIVGEVVVRVLPRRYLPELGPVQPATHYLGGMARLSDNPALYYELVPGKNGVNEDGYRGPRYDTGKPPGVTRIVGVGNSTLFGLGLDEEKDTYLRRLEGLLDGAMDAEVQVVNLGVPGYNTHQELEMLRARGLDYHPDLVILGYDHNDPGGILGRSRPPMPDDYGRNLLHSELVRYLMRTFYSRPKINFHRRVDGHITGGEGWDRHFDALAGIADTCHARGIEVVVVIYDAMIHREEREGSRHYRKLHAPFEEFWKEHGYHVVDCYDLFQEYMRENDEETMQSLWVSVEPRDAHPDPAGHDLIAHAVFDLIRRDGLIE